MTNQRIAISGTYSTGKTTTSYALSYLTGIPRTHAQTMREILPIINPGKRLEDCTPPELYELGIRRLTERVNCERMLDNSFISDGSALHEWVYGKARLKVGLNPNEKGLKRIYSRIRLFPYTVPMSQFINDYEKLVKLHTKNSYDLFIHLPIEFPISQDGHRPVNENFRILSNDYLLNTLEELKIPHIIVGGSIEERLFKIVTELGLSPKMSIEEAVSLAKSEAHKRNSIEIEYDKSLKNKI
ncbi:ATP-binding protein [Parabacteroides sp. OttesenSCG-928-J18]|nr:ATP-binding protein [Parabacteroides sp. OttesenSCG-928-J18]MDL2255237.1 ATP-binding protein [Parabacteroides sp. OttesenSCG-928-K15]MDL2306379.1 ATP-binding protein [Bacteroides sp. OttesenSCG-928-D19]